MNKYRVTIPNRYPPGTPGYSDPSARQGYYVKAVSVRDALIKAKAMLVDASCWGPNDNFEAELWERITP